MKLFQIEEPEGGPADPDQPGVAFGVDLSGSEAVVGFAVGGNAVVLADREGFEEALPVPSLGAAADLWQTLFEGARLRAERALARPATHAVVALASDVGFEALRPLLQGAEAAGLEILQIGPLGDALAAALLAENLAPRPEPPAVRDTR